MRKYFQLALLLAACATQAQFQAILNVTDLPGSSGNSTGDDIYLTAFQWSVKHPLDTNGALASASFSLSIEKNIDSFSPALSPYPRDAQSNSIPLWNMKFRLPLGFLLSENQEVITLADDPAVFTHSIDILRNVSRESLTISSSPLLSPLWRLEWSNRLFDFSMNTGTTCRFGDIEDDSCSTPLRGTWSSLKSFSVSLEGMTENGGPSSTTSFPRFTLLPTPGKAIEPLVSRCIRGTPLTNCIIDSFVRDEQGQRGWYHFNLAGAWITGVSQWSTNSHELNQSVELMAFNAITWSYVKIPAGIDETNMAVWIYSSQAGGSLSNYITSTAIQKSGETNVNLTWPALEGEVYDVLGAANVTGPFVSVQKFYATNSGPMTVTLPISSGQYFFRVKFPFE